MARDVHQFKLPFNAAQDSENARRTAIGKVILKLGGSSNRLPLIELREFLIWVNNVGGGSGEPLVKSYEQLGAAPWGLCCSAATAYRVVTIALHKRLIRKEEQLGANYEQRPNSYRMNWPGVYEFINDLPANSVRQRDDPPRHADEPPRHADEPPRHADEPPRHADERFKEQPPSIPPLSPLFFDDVDVGEGEFRNEGDQITDHDSDPPDRPEFAPLASHGCSSPNSAVATVESRGSTPATKTQLVKLVRHCGVRAAALAVQAAIQHGHDVRAWVSAWQFFRPGWIGKYAPVHLYEQLCEEPCGLDPWDPKSWPPLDFPDRVPTPDAVAQERRKAAETAEYLAAKASRERRGMALGEAKARVLAMPESESSRLLSEFLPTVSDFHAAMVVKAKPPVTHFMFLEWFIKRNGGSNGESS